MDKFWPLLNQIMLTTACISTVINGLGIIYLIGKFRMTVYAVELMTYEKANEAEDSDKQAQDRR